MTSQVLLTSRWGTYELQGDAPVLHRLERLAWPHLTPAHAPGPLPHWRVRLRGTGEVAGSRERQPPHEVWVDPARRELSMRAPDDWAPIVALRHLRTIERSEAIACGALPFHGACIELGGLAFLLVGGHRSGKTTAALSLSRAFGARLVSNHEVLLDRRDRVGATGLPRSIGIRVDSLAEHEPALTQETLDAARGLHPGYAVAPAKVFLAQAELTRIGVTPEITWHPIAAVIELEMSSAATGRVAPVRSAEAVLHRWLDTDFDHGEQTIGIGPGVPSRKVRADMARQLLDVAPLHRFEHSARGWLGALLRWFESRVPT